MDYLITNSSKNLYIRLDDKGHPVTCVKSLAQRFESSKAKNVLDNLPKTLKNFHFKIKAVPEVETVVVHKDDDNNEERDKVLISTCYMIPKRVNQWVERVKNCNDLAKDADKRKGELIEALSNVDKDLSNCLHKIELTKWKNGCDGYKEYKAVKSILERRRGIKDELTVVQSILESNLQSMASDRIEKVVKRLENRVFNIREVQNYDIL